MKPVLLYLVLGVAGFALGAGGFALWLSLADLVRQVWGLWIGLMFAVSPFVLIGGLLLWLTERRRFTP